MYQFSLTTLSKNPFMTLRPEEIYPQFVSHCEVSFPVHEGLGHYALGRQVHTQDSYISFVYFGQPL